MKNKTIQIGISAGLIFVILLMLNPYHVWVHDAMTSFVVGLLIVFFCAFSIFVFGETGGDERELSHRMLSGRAAFFAGGLVLLVGIIIQGIQASPDPWLTFALAAMVFAKIGFRLYSDHKL
jgi:hypothetical protein